MNRVIGMGNALIDILTRLDDDKVLSDLELPKGSMQLVGQEAIQRVLEATASYPRHQASGGSAANTIHGLASLGIETAFIGKVGRDEWGGFFRSDLERRNIKPILLEGKQESGRAFAFISPDAERTFATYLGAAIELEPRDVAEHLFEDYHFLHIEGYLVQNKSLIQHALQTAKKKGLQVSLDLASFNVVEENRDFLHEIVKNYVDILFANEEEAKAFTGLTDGAALHRLSEFSNVAVLKLGSKGSIIKHQDRVVEVAATEAVSRDTTGAGDLYASGFLFGLIHGLPIEQCGEIASLLAGRVIEVIGPKIDDQAWKDINRQVMKYVN